MQWAAKWKTTLAALLAALALAGAVWAQDKQPAGKPLDRAALDEAIYQSLRGIIDHGADLYNQGDWNGCYRLWEGALMSLKPLLGERQLRSWAKTATGDNTVYTEALKGLQSQLGDGPRLKKVIDTALATAQQTPSVYRRAFILRVALDQLRAETKPAKAAVAKGSKSNGAPAKKKTLWDRLGGEAGVTKIIDDFVNLAAPDPKIDFFRGGKFQMTPDQVVKMKREMVEQISQASGGPLKYTGPDMKKIHKGMGITQGQFKAAAADLKKALEKNNVAAEDVKKILDAVGSYGKDIVEPKKGEKKPGEKKPEKTADISGKVMYKGKALTRGIISFVDKDFAFSGTIAANDGAYMLKVKPGTYKVAIATPAAAKIMAPPKGNAPPDPKKMQKIVIVPAKYSDPDKSGLTCTVKEGRQTFDIDLK